MKLKKSTLLTKLIVLILAVYATITLLSLQSQILEAETEATTLQEQVDSVTQANNRLEAEIANVGTEEGLEGIARSSLGYVSDGEIIFYDIGD